MRDIMGNIESDGFSMDVEVLLQISACNKEVDVTLFSPHAIRVYKVMVCVGHMIGGRVV